MSTFLFFLFAIIFIIALFVPTKSLPESFKSVKKSVLTGSIFVMILSSLWAGYYSVPAGHRGVLLQFGAVNGTLSEGIHFVPPFMQRVELVEVRTQKEEATAAASSRDLQNVSTKIAINYRLDPNTVGELYKKVGLSYATRIIDPATQETVKAVIAKYTAEDLIRQRAVVKNEIDSELAARLRVYNIIVEPNGVSLTNFEFSEQYTAAIEAKQVTQQLSEKAKYELVKAEIDAKTAIAEAKGEAEANRIKAQALNANGGEKVLAREWIMKWDGHQPQVMAGGSSNGFMLNLSDLVKNKKENE